MSQTATEDALRDAVVVGAGGATVIWAHQDGPRPAVPFVSLSHGAQLTVGMVESSHAFDAGADPGEEITYTDLELNEATLSIQVFGTVLGDSSAMAIARNIRRAFDLRSVRADLEAAGLSVFDTGTVVPVHTVLDADWEGRASVDLRYYTYESQTETNGYIDTVNVDGPTDDDGFTVGPEEP